MSENFVEQVNPDIKGANKKANENNRRIVILNEDDSLQESLEKLGENDEAIILTNRTPQTGNFKRKIDFTHIKCHCRAIVSGGAAFYDLENNIFVEEEKNGVNAKILMSCDTAIQMAEEIWKDSPNVEVRIVSLNSEVITAKTKEELKEKLSKENLEIVKVSGVKEDGEFNLKVQNGVHSFDQITKQYRLDISSTNMKEALKRYFDYYELPTNNVEAYLYQSYCKGGDNNVQDCIEHELGGSVHPIGRSVAETMKQVQKAQEYSR